MDEEFLSYLVGFAYTDGNYYENTRDRGRYRFELNIRDRDILEKIQKGLPCHSSISERKRETNFKKIHTCSLSFYEKSFREELREITLNISENINNNTISKRVLLRAIYEADGSWGFLKDGRPFLSICITEDEVKDLVIELILKTTGKQRKCSRNKRDNVYNIMVYSEDVQKILSYLYQDATIYIDRKYDIFKDIMNWSRENQKEKK